jgi:hypothetical protein
MLVLTFAASVVRGDLLDLRCEHVFGYSVSKRACMFIQNAAPVFCPMGLRLCCNLFTRGFITPTKREIPCPMMI